MEFAILLWAALTTGALLALAFKWYIKRNFPGVYFFMYEKDTEFDKVLQAIKTGFKE